MKEEKGNQVRPSITFVGLALLPGDGIAVVA